MIVKFKNLIKFVFLCQVTAECVREGERDREIISTKEFNLQSLKIFEVLKPDHYDKTGVHESTQNLTI